MDYIDLTPGETMTVNVFGSPMVATLSVEGLSCDIWNDRDDAPIATKFITWDALAKAMGAEFEYHNRNYLTPK